MKESGVDFGIGTAAGKAQGLSAMSAPSIEMSYEGIKESKCRSLVFVVVTYIGQQSTS